jgi:hypothetical protein
MVKPEDASTQLQPIVEVLYASLEKGLEDASLFFQQMGWEESYDVWLFAHLVRASAKSRLVAAGLACTEDVVPEPAMSGLLIQHGTLFIKVRKSMDGLLPVPSSMQAAAFYEQQSLLEDMDTANLLLLWRNTGPRLDSLQLAQPSGWLRQSRRVSVDWQVVLPRTARRELVADLDLALPPADEDSAAS